MPFFFEGVGGWVPVRWCRCEWWAFPACVFVIGVRAVVWALVSCFLLGCMGGGCVACIRVGLLFSALSACLAGPCSVFCCFCWCGL